MGTQTSQKVMESALSGSEQTPHDWFPRAFETRDQTTQSGALLTLQPCPSLPLVPAVGPSQHLSLECTQSDPRDRRTPKDKRCSSRKSQSKQPFVPIYGTNWKDIRLAGKRHGMGPGPTRTLIGGSVENPSWMMNRLLLTRKLWTHEFNTFKDKSPWSWIKNWLHVTLQSKRIKSTNAKWRHRKKHEKKLLKEYVRHEKRCRRWYDIGWVLV